jgi:hypothetical protein
MYREVVLACRVLDTISRDFFRIPWNHSNWQNDRCHFECFVCFGKTSKMYREVRRSCRVLDTMARLSPIHHLPAFLGRQARTDKVFCQCHFECFVCFGKTSKMYREVVLACRVLDTISWDFFRIPWNHSNWQSVASMSLRACLRSLVGRWFSIENCIEK